MSDHDCQHQGLPALDLLQDRSQWLMALGACLVGGDIMVIGVMLLGAGESILCISGMMLVAGIQQVVYAFSTHARGCRVLQQMSGVAYATAGAVAVFDPLLLHADIQAAIGALVLLAGMLRGALATRERRERGGVCIGVAALVTCCAGAAIMLAGPVITMWMVGTVLTVDLLLQGLAFFAFGWRMGADATLDMPMHMADRERLPLRRVSLRPTGLFVAASIPAPRDEAG